MDTLVFDIETKNFFTDPGVGWNNFDALQISMVCVYSYAKNKYFSFDENQLDDAAKLFDSGSLLVGFSINRYDIPVLDVHFGKLSGEKVNLWDKNRLDILEEIEMAFGQRISLDKLSRANLGVGKERKGHEAITMYKNGEMEELKKYCLQDVRLTKELYDLYRDKGELIVPNVKTGDSVKVNFKENNSYARLSF